MSQIETVKPQPQGGTPAWDEQQQFFRMRFWFRVLFAVVVSLWILLIVWVLVLAPITRAPVASLAVGANLTIVLAPVLAAAAAVERTLEIIFNVLEGSWRTMVAYLGRGLRWLKSVEAEVKQARQFLTDVSDKYNLEMESIQVGQGSAATLSAEIQARMDVANLMMALAQRRLDEAEINLASVTSSDNYINAKVAASIVLGLMLGVIVAALAQLQMFAMLGIGLIPARIDVLITGFVIGSGAYPVHSLVGILQQGKDTLDSMQGYFDRLSPATQASRQKITTVQSPAVPGAPTQVQQAIIETTTAKTTDEGPHK